jgi:hypothetical protein
MGIFPKADEFTIKQMIARRKKLKEDLKGLQAMEILLTDISYVDDNYCQITVGILEDSKKTMLHKMGIKVLKAQIKELENDLKYNDVDLKTLDV